jgi:hypothetical protein
MTNKAPQTTPGIGDSLSERPRSAPQAQAPASSGAKRAGGALKVSLAAGAALLACAAALFVCGGGASALVGGIGVREALRDRLFLACAGVGAVSALGLAILCGAMWAAGGGRRGGGNPRGRAASEEGTATLEFAAILPIALMFALAMTQSSLLMGGNLCVKYAAFCAARTAIITVPRDFGVDEPRNVVAGTADEGGKMYRVKQSAVWAVLPFSCAHPDAPSLDAGSLRTALLSALAALGCGAPAWMRGEGLDRRLGYADAYTEVVLDPPANGASSYAPAEDLRVNVRHDFYLSVPYAARVFSRVAGDGLSLDFGAGHYAIRMRSACRLTNEGEQDFVDVESFPRDRTRN